MLDHRDHIAGFIEGDFVHESSDQEQATTIRLSDVTGRSRIRQGGRIEARSLVLNNESRKTASQLRCQPHVSASIGRTTIPFLKNSALIGILVFSFF